MTRIVALIAVLSIVGCGKKSEPASSGSAASAGSAAAATNAPKDDASQAFVKSLLGTTVHNFSPINNGDMKFEYVTLTFGADNSFMAISRMGEGDDTVDCKEFGTWSMDAADSASTAAMEWKITGTTCPGRPKDNIMRVKMTIEGKEYTIKFR